MSMVGSTERQESCGDDIAVPDGARLLPERGASVLSLNRFGGDNWKTYVPPLLFVVIVLVIDVPILSTIGWFQTDRATYMWSLWPITAVGMMYAVFIGVHLRNRYLDAIDQFDEELHTALRSTLTSPVRFGMMGVWIVGFVINLLSNPEVVRTFLKLEGEIIGVIKYAILGGIYTPIIAELSFLIIVIHIVLPYKIWRERPSMDFSDPKGFGGLFDVGQVLVRSTSLYFVGLLAWTAQPVIHMFIDSPWPSPTTQLTILMFYLLWGSLVVLYVVPVAAINRHMRSQKEAELKRIQGEIEALGTDNKQLPYTDPPDYEISSHLDQYFKLYHVGQTREYPADFHMVQELVLAALIPLIGHVIVTILTSGLGH